MSYQVIPCHARLSFTVGLVSYHATRKSLYAPSPLGFTTFDLDSRRWFDLK